MWVELHGHPGVADLLTGGQGRVAELGGQQGQDRAQALAPGLGQGENIQKYPKKEALMRKIDAHWQPISWEKLGAITTQLSKALLQQGVAPQQTVGILSQNTPQWTLTDLACLQIRAVTVPIYTS